MPPTAIRGVPVAANAPTGTANVTVRSVESTSVNAAGAPGQTRLLATSSVTRNTAGAQALGASFTAAITIVLVSVDECRNVP